MKYTFKYFLPLEKVKFTIFLCIAVVLLSALFGMQYWLIMFEGIKLIPGNLVFIIFVFVFSLVVAHYLDKARFNEIRSWADFYNLEIVELRAHDLFDSKPTFFRFWRREYDVSLHSESGKQGLVRVVFPYNKYLRPKITWLSEPLSPGANADYVL